MVSRRFLGLLAVLLIVAGLGLPLAATTTTAPTATTGAGGTATTAGVIVPAVSVGGHRTNRDSTRLDLSVFYPRLAGDHGAWW